MKRESPLVNTYVSDGALITKLQTQVTATTNARQLTALNKKLTAEQAAQAKVFAQDTSAFNAAETD